MEINIELREKLLNTLLELSKKIENEIKQVVDNDQLIRIPYEKIKAIDLRYEVYNITYNLDWDNIEYYDHLEWPSDVFIEFMGKAEQMEEYKAAVGILSQLHNPEGSILHNAVLHPLLRLLMNRIPNNPTLTKKLKNFIEIFITDCEKSSSGKEVYDWTVKIWIKNIYLEDENITLDENIKLRKPTPDDFTIIQPRRAHISESDRMFSYAPDMSAILELSLKAGRAPRVGKTYNDKIQKQMEIIINILRLFKLGDIHPVYRSAYPASVIERGTEEGLISPFDTSWKDKVEHQDVTHYYYVIKQSESSLLQAFYKKMFGIISKLSHTNYLSGSSYELALHRYIDAIQRSELKVNRILSAISSLEAMLSESPGDITYKISLRIAGLLRHVGFNAISVNKQIKTAYDLRSRLVHGQQTVSQKGDNLIEFARNNHHEIINQIRVCLTIFLQLEKCLDRSKLLKTLDQSFIDDDIKAKLQQTVTENSTVYTNVH